MQDFLMKTLDKGTRQNAKIEPIPLASKVKDMTLKLSTNTESKISDLLKNGPLVLIFIRGTWCPFCRIHLQKLRSWAENLQQKQATIVVVSSESMVNIKSWLQMNPVSFIFASDEDYELGDYFGARIKPNTHFQAVTFLIDTDQSVRLAYRGKRTTENFDAIDAGFAAFK